jgi:hypothetical protein
MLDNEYLKTACLLCAQRMSRTRRGEGIVWWAL